jgi:hypothetical protein
MTPVSPARLTLPRSWREKYSCPICRVLLKFQKSSCGRERPSLHERDANFPTVFFHSRHRHRHIVGAWHVPCWANCGSRDWNSVWRRSWDEECDIPPFPRHHLGIFSLSSREVGQKENVSVQAPAHPAASPSLVTYRRELGSLLRNYQQYVPR